MPHLNPAACPLLDKLAGFAVNYYNDFVKPAKKYRNASPQEAAAFAELVEYLKGASDSATSEELQTQVYEIGKKHEFTDLKLWFASLYEVLLGQSAGPRMGSFIALFGRKETIALIERALSGEFSKAA